MTSPSPVTSNQVPLNILLVDDDDFLLELMQTALFELGANSVQLARNGLEGLKAYKNATQKPNLVICDLCMPELGGMEFLSHLSREACQADVFIMSGHNHVPPTDRHWNLSNYSGPVLNLAEKLARIQGLKVKATIEKPITRQKICQILVQVGHSMPDNTQA